MNSNGIDKDIFHRQTARQLRKVAKALGLATGAFEVRSNKAGTAVLGEVTLHAEGLYVQVGCSFGDPTVLYRSCKGRRDYTGGMNNYLPVEMLMCHLDAAVERFRGVMVTPGMQSAK